MSSTPDHQQPQQPYGGQQPFGAQGQPPYGAGQGYPQPNYNYPPPAPKKKSGMLKGCLIAFGVVAVLGIGLIVLVTVVFAKGVSDVTTAKHTVVYSVSGAGKADMTYSTDTGMSSAQDSGATLPWSKTFKVKGITSGMNVSAQNDGSGVVSCKITIDGKVVKQATATGAYSIADCVAP